MFEGARRSAEAQASVMGPNGPWITRHEPDDPSVPLSPIGLQARVDFWAHLACAAIVVAIAAATDRSWSLIALGVGAVIGLSLAVGGLREGFPELEHPAPVDANAAVETTRNVRNRALRASYSAAGQGAFFSIIWIGQQPWIAGGFAGMLVPATFVAWRRWQTIRGAEERLDGRLMQRLHRAAEPLSLKGQIYLERSEGHQA